MSNLKWPANWPRATVRKGAAFSSTANNGSKRPISVADAINRLDQQLDLLKAKDAILSTNLETRLDGTQRSGQAEPRDPGAALYFKLDGKETVLACDKWDRVADNITAIAKHIEAIRGIDRWGVGSLAQAFAGYQALPAPEQWWQVLGVDRTADAATIQTAYRHLAAKAHPDTGGSDAAMARLNAARDAAMKEPAQ